MLPPFARRQSLPSGFWCHNTSMNVRPQPCFLPVLALVASAFGPAYGQKLTPPPFAFPPSFQAPRPAQVPNLTAGRTQAKTRVKTILRQKPPTKAQLNQALIAEAYRRNTANVTKLLAQGADPNARDKAGVSVLFYAAAVKDNIFVVTLLLGKGANVNARDPHGNTPLAEAVQLGNRPLTTLLFEHKADPNVRNRAGFTPLGVAAAKNDAPTMTLLLAHGADPNAAQHEGLTPLVLAVGRGNPEAVRLLLDAGAAVNSSAKSGSISPLSVAVAALHQAPGGTAREAVLLTLLDHKADANGRDVQGNPPLMVSVSLGDLTGMRLLLEHRAKADAPDCLGETLWSRSAEQSTPESRISTG